MMSMHERNQSILNGYPEVLDPKHIKEILRIGEKQTYELLNRDPPPFHYVRVGRMIKVSKVIFEKWLTGN
jgi:hypothetical protein